jgi:hypothetical protein
MCGNRIWPQGSLDGFSKPGGVIPGTKGFCVAEIGVVPCRNHGIILDSHCIQEAPALCSAPRAALNWVPTPLPPEFRQ